MPPLEERKGLSCEYAIILRHIGRKVSEPPRILNRVSLQFILSSFYFSQFCLLVSLNTADFLQMTGVLGYLFMFEKLIGSSVSIHWDLHLVDFTVG